MKRLHALVARLMKPTRSAAQARTARLACETLDDRCLPSAGLAHSSSIVPMDAFHRHPSIAVFESISHTDPGRISVGHPGKMSEPAHGRPAAMESDGTDTIRFYQLD